MSDEENPSDKTTHGSQSVVIESASSKPAPLHRPPDRSADETLTPSQKVVPTIINMSSERHKHFAKNLSASIPSKRRDTKPTEIPMGPIEKHLKRDEIVVMTAPIQPIAVLGKPASPIPSTRVQDDEKEDVDSITSEIKELRTPEVLKKTPEWSDEEEAGGLPRNESRASRTSRGSRVSRVVRQFFCCGLQIEAPSEDNETEHHTNNNDATEEEEPVPLQRKLGNEILTASLVMNEANEDDVSTSSDITKKKEITWSEDTYYLEKMTLQNLGVRSASWMLERKASVGPCYKQGMLFGEPSGISICLPKKHLKYVSSVLESCKPIKSGISIVISRKCSDKKSKLFGPVQFEMRRAKVSSMRKEGQNTESKIKIDNYNHYYATLRGKLDNLYGRIKHALHM